MNVAAFSPSCALRRDHKLLVSAQAASGKSVALAQLSIAAARQTGSAKQPVLPLKIPLVAFGAMIGETSERGTGLLWQYLSERENLAPSRVACLERALTHGAMMLLLDGLDEATTQIETVLQWLDEITAAHPRLRVVMSSRPVAGVDQSALASRGFRFLQVEPLAPSQVRRSLRRWIAPRLLSSSSCTKNDITVRPALPCSMRSLDDDTDARRGRTASR